MSTISKQWMATSIDSALDASEAADPPKTTFMVMAGVALFALVQGAIGEQAVADTNSTTPVDNSRTITLTQE